MTNFVHLTNKTEYSLSEGAITINRIAELCESFQMPAVGITDTNNMFGALEFSDKISSYGVQPLIGCNIKINIPNEYNLDASNEDKKYFFLNLFDMYFSNFNKFEFNFNVFDGSQSFFFMQKYCC